ncbi:MAG: type II secretion system protein [Planctomycetota bacterium]
MSFQNHSHRFAFTLVELLVAMVIAGILGSMVAIALQGAQRQAQDTRAQAMIDRLNISMLRLYEEESFARVNLPAGYASIQTRSLADLMWKRDWLRCAFPNSRQDISQGPARIPYPLAPMGSGVWSYLDDGGRSTAGVSTLPVAVPGITSGTTTSSKRAGQLLRLRQRIARTIGAAQGVTVSTYAQLVDGNAANGEWTTENQSSECLYLILSTNTLNGVPATDALRTRDVGDTDEDGMPEVLDSWGVPVGFMRWPCGFLLTDEWGVFNEDPASTVTRAQWDWVNARKVALGRDTLDVLNVDPRYTDNATLPPLVNGRAEDPFPLIPMIISAGNDGDFDLFGLDDDGTGLPLISYATATNGWPSSSPSSTTPAGFPGAVTFVDPYLDGSQISSKLGARGDANGDGDDESADNIYPSLSF